MTSQPPSPFTPPPTPPPTPPGGSIPPALPPAGGSGPPFPPGAPPPGPVRYPRRSSIFSGLLLILVGVLLLVAQLHPGVRLGYIITHFWPLLIILWGISKLIDRYAHPQRGPHTATLSGGEIALIFVLVSVVGLVAFGTWVRARLPRAALDLAPFAPRYSQTRQVNGGAIPPASVITISTANGGITAHAGSDNLLQVNANESAGGDSESAAQDRIKNVDVQIQGSNGAYRVQPVNANRGDISVDLDVSVPKLARIIARAQRGSVTVADVQGGADASTRNGDIQIHDTASNVTAQLQNGAAHIQNVAGSVNLDGRGGGDVEIAGVQGDVNVTGNLFGDVEIRNVAKSVHYASPRCTVQLASVAGELKIDTSNIVLSRGVGPVTISARNQDVRVDSVEGQLAINESRGDISVTYPAQPTGAINITSQSGDVTLNLPPNANFTISAESKSGDITDDFAANPEHADDHAPHHIDATHGSGGPVIHITTTYGDIHIGNSQ